MSESDDLLATIAALPKPVLSTAPLKSMLGNVRLVYHCAKCKTPVFLGMDPPAFDGADLTFNVRCPVCKREEHGIDPSAPPSWCLPPTPEAP
jgi:DNA-directed RNA polymerase subunit RPC12/RpoP